MSKLDELVADLCPNGVKYYTLNECFDQFSGMGGVTNKWADTGNCQFVDYMNAYNHIAVDVQDLPFATVKTLNQTVLRQGDVLFTSASETPDECAISSLIEDEIKDGIFLDDHLFGLRIKKQFSHIIFTSFLKYAFRTNNFRQQVKRAVRGVTRFYVSKQDFMNLVIPVPPLEVQREIVRVLDKFTFLTAELTAELTARRKQYDYYRNKLMIFNDSVEWKALGDIFDIVDYRGKTPKKTDKGIFLVTAKNIRKGYIDYESSKEYISHDSYEDVMHRGKPQIGDILITTEAPCGNVALVDRDNIALAQRVIKYRPKDADSINTVFVKHYMLSNEFQNRLLKAATGGTVKGIKGSKLHLMKIPVPTINLQNKLAHILDSFDVVCNDISIGLPAEIAARQKQYEYYKDKLLTFKELNA